MGKITQECAWRLSLTELEYYCITIGLMKKHIEEVMQDCTMSVWNSTPFDAVLRVLHALGILAADM